MSKRLDPTIREASILAAAVKLSEKHGYSNITREMVAVAAKCSPALISAYYGSFEPLRSAVLRHAVVTSNLTILAQGLVARHRIALAAPQALKAKAAKLLIA